MAGSIPVEHAGRNLYVVLPLNGFPSRPQAVVKRAFGLAIGAAGLVVTGVLLPVVWRALPWSSPGP